MTAHTQEIDIILQQLLKARARDVHELDLGLLGGPRRHAAFHKVLLARPRCLDHLITRSAAPIHVVLAEEDRRVVNDAGLLIGKKILVSTVLRNECLLNLLPSARPIRESAKCGILGESWRTNADLLQQVRQIHGND